MHKLSRRGLVFGTPFLFAGCDATNSDAPGVDPSALYGTQSNDLFPVPAIDFSRIDPRFYRQVVAYSTKEKPGTIVVDPARHFLYFVLAGGRAVRYGVGVGKAGFAWSGVAQIERKSEWPKWFPPADMQKRDSDLARWSNGVPGGNYNPLGARAMYLYQNGRDTMYRIHGTNEPWSVGHSVSSGCIRMLNQDVIDLYRRAPIGTKVVVLNS